MRLASRGSEMPKSHRQLPNRHRHSFRPMRERRIIRGLDRRSPVERSSSRNCPPGRRALFSIPTKAEPMSALERINSLSNNIEVFTDQRESRPSRARFPVAGAQLFLCFCGGTAHFNLRAVRSAFRFSHRAGLHFFANTEFLNPAQRRTKMPAAVFPEAF